MKYENKIAKNEIRNAKLPIKTGLRTAMNSLSLETTKTRSPDEESRESKADRVWWRSLQRTMSPEEESKADRGVRRRSLEPSPEWTQYFNKTGFSVMSQNDSGSVSFSSLAT